MDEYEVQASLFEVQLKGQDLAKVLRNVQLWQEPGVSLTHGRVFILFDDLRVCLYATDGYTAVVDRMEYTEALPLPQDVGFWLSEDELDAFILMAVDAKTGPLRLRFEVHEGAWRLETPYAWEWGYEDPKTAKNPEELRKTKIALRDGSSFFGEPSDLPEWAEALEEALEEADTGYLYPGPDSYAIRPERFVKFFRVRADKEAPVAFRLLAPLNDKSGPMAAVKLGWTFRALVNFVNLKTARENLPEDQRVFLW